MSGPTGPREPLWRRYLRFFGPDVATDVEDELQLHFDLRVRDCIRHGLTPEQARAKVSSEFGDIDEARRQCRSIGEVRLRQASRGQVLDGLRRDLGFGLRRAVRNPGFSLTAVLSLALGLGATVAIFSVVHGVLLRPLPFPEPERLVRLYEISPRGDVQNPISAPNYLDWRARTRSFAGMGAHHWPYQISVSGGSGDPARISINDLTLDALQVLSPRPLLGRLFTQADAAGQGERVLLISYRLWQNRFGSDSAVLGSTIQIDEAPHEIVGVMRPDFDFPHGFVDLWRPVGEASLDPTNRRSHNLAVVARLRPGVGLEQAQTEMTALARDLGREHPEFMEGWGVNVVPIHSDLVAPVRPLLVVLLSGVGLVLLIACTNVANLLLARAVGRELEISVRGALGASRSQVLRQLLLEAAVLAVAAGVSGIIAGQVMLAGLLRLAPTDIPLLDEVRLDRTALLFGLLITALSTFVFALAPAFRLSRADLQGALRSDRSGGTMPTRLRAALVVLEVALAVVLMIGAGLLIRSFDRLQSVDLGFDPSGLLAVGVTASPSRYREPPAQTEFYQRLLDRVRLIPGVTAVTSTSATPADPSATTFSFAIEGRQAPGPSGRFDPVPLELVTPGYFTTLGIPILRGRAIEASDRADAPPVLLVNEALARTHWPAGDPVGQRIAFRAEGPWWEIVGIAGDTRMFGADRDPVPMLYLPFAQKPWAWFRWQTVLLRPRTGTQPLDLIPALRAATAEVDPQLVLPQLSTVEQLYRESAARRRFATVLLGGFAAAALTLGLIGVYGVLSTVVAQRTQELAIRVALGADRSQVIGLILGQAVRLSLAGVGLGLLGAFAATRLLKALLFDVSPVDPATYGVVAVLLLAISAGTAMVPAWRAARVDPVSAMRGST